MLILLPLNPKPSSQLLGRQSSQAGKAPNKPLQLTAGLQVAPTTKHKPPASLTRTAQTISDVYWHQNNAPTALKDFPVDLRLGMRIISTHENNHLVVLQVVKTEDSNGCIFSCAGSYSR